jgi:hypothetical protein
MQFITDADCIDLPKKELTNLSVFIFDKYAWNFKDSLCSKSTSEAFNYIQTTEALILGTKACVSCFLENITTPAGLLCIYSFSMRNLVISTSGLSPQEKIECKSLISKMGGHYVGDLLDICTHLIASSTKSAKYEEAAKRGMVVMHPDWVKDVWKRTIDDQKVQGVDKQFDKHKLPIFYGCCITTTGMSTAEKDLIKTLVEGNGGKYSGAFKSEDVDILIVSRERSDSEKFYHLLKTKGKAQVKIQNQTQTKRSGSRPKTAAV